MESRTFKSRLILGINIKHKKKETSTEPVRTKLLFINTKKYLKKLLKRNPPPLPKIFRHNKIKDSIIKLNDNYYANMKNRNKFNTLELYTDFDTTAPLMKSWK